MTKFVFVFFCLVAIQTTWALKCKSCKNTECKELEDMTCPAAPAGAEPACLSHRYKVNKDSKDEIVEKKCVNKSKDAKYACITHSKDEVELECETCTEELCNSATTTSVAILTLMVAILAPKFF